MTEGGGGGVSEIDDSLVALRQFIKTGGGVRWPGRGFPGHFFRSLHDRTQGEEHSHCTEHLTTRIYAIKLYWSFQYLSFEQKAWRL